MRIVVVLATILALAAARSRDRRQATGCFWWEDDNCDVSPSTTTTTTTTQKPANAPPSDGVRSGSGVNSNTATNQISPSDYPSCNFGTGQCVPYYLCREGNIITDGAGLIDIRIGPPNTNGEEESTSHSECPQFLDVCCNSPETTPIEVSTPPPATVKTCGHRNENGLNTRIVGFKDNQAQFAEFPWMAAILRKEFIEEKELNLYVCGGSLIHPRVVLTAAHCVHQRDAQSLKVRLGEWDTQRTYEEFGHVDYNVISVTINDQFHPQALHNDFALLFLEDKQVDQPNIGSVCLPAANQNFDYDTCWATGWGRDEFGKQGKYQNVLKEVALPVVPNGQCENSLRTTRLGQFFKLHESFMCAGGQQGQDTCKGDGGSPLVCEVAPGTGTYVQAGIVAWGIGCGENGIPGVYADVSFASNWIVSNADAGLAALYNQQYQNPHSWYNYKK